VFLVHFDPQITARKVSALLRAGVRGVDEACPIVRQQYHGLWLDPLIHPGDVNQVEFRIDLSNAEMGNVNPAKDSRIRGIRFYLMLIMN